MKTTALAGMALLSLSAFTTFSVSANEGKGLRPITKEEDQKISKIKIKKIHLNKHGLKRINDQRIEQGLEPLPESAARDNDIETETSGAEFSSGLLGSVSLSALPAQVDNSAMAAFPKIGNQASQNSCAAWATTYYLMAHEVCLTLGCDNKNLGAKVFSPKWTYNMINSGADSGAYFSDAFGVIAHHGAPTLTELPYGTDYLPWDLNSAHWKSAINYRMAPLSTTPVGTDIDMANVKQILLNGHVVVVGTYVTSWQYKTVGVNPNSPTNPHAGQAIAYYLNGNLGGHAMTIVGYDDNIWTDINSNGTVDTGETGAFKIANSWGASWKNAGHIWAAYDAFRITSAVPGFTPATRVALAQNSGNKVLMSTYTAYTPKLLAKVTVSHSLRNQMSLVFGTSASTSSTPASFYTPAALNYKGGGWAFNGTTTETAGTFYFDISSLLTSTVDQQRFYLKASDNAASNLLAVNSFQVVDPATDTVLMDSADAPATIDAGNTTLAAGTLNRDTTLPSTPVSLGVTLTSKKVGRKVTYFANLSWAASTDNVGVAKYYIYRNSVKFAESTTTAYSDSTTQAGVSYIYQVAAVDTSGNVSLVSAPINFKR